MVDVHPNRKSNYARNRSSSSCPRKSQAKNCVITKGLQKTLQPDLESKILEGRYESVRAGRNSRVDKVRSVSPDFRRRFRGAEAGVLRRSSVFHCRKSFRRRPSFREGCPIARSANLQGRSHVRA